MNPCTIVILIPIFIVPSLSNNQVESTDKVGNSQSEGGSLLKVIYIEIDLSKKRSTSEYIYKQEGDVETYRANPGYAIKKYTDTGGIKWVSYGTTYLKEVKKTKQQDGTFTYKVVRCDPTQSSLPSTIRVVTQDPKDPFRTVENDESQYEMKRDNKLVTYKLNDGVECFEVRYDNKEPLKQEPDKPNEIPKSVLFNTRAKTIVFVFEEKISVYKLDEGVWHQAYYGEPKTVELDLMGKKSTDEYDYTNENGIGTYTVKPGYFFNKVRKSCSIWGSKCCCCCRCSESSCLIVILSGLCCVLNGCCSCVQTIYEADEFKHYSIRVVSDGLQCCKKIENVSIDLVNGQSKYFWNNVGELAKIKGTTLFSINLSRKQSTPYYDYVCENKRHIYTAKYNCFFNSLGHSTRSKCTPVVIWKPSDGDSYIVKVVLDESSSEHVITAYLANGMGKRFVKSGDLWEEKVEKKATSEILANSGGVDPSG